MKRWEAYPPIFFTRFSLSSVSVRIAGFRRSVCPMLLHSVGGFSGKDDFYPEWLGQNT